MRDLWKIGKQTEQHYLKGQLNLALSGKIYYRYEYTEFTHTDTLYAVSKIFLQCETEKVTITSENYQWWLTHVTPSTWEAKPGGLPQFKVTWVYTQ